MMLLNEDMTCNELKMNTLFQISTSYDQSMIIANWTCLNSRYTRSLTHTFNILSESMLKYHLILI